ncbi:alkaline phosphatase D family protein [Croceimicrobium sp.]|uniref:alkaline phosphatase D family protein n=1 Tax=Croceimicrobium sp. TaxID=2828340 RepID=UPI003BAA6A24
MKRLAFSIALSILSLTIVAQSNEVLSGPVLGYAEMKEALIWVQLRDKGSVKLNYWPQNSPEQKQETDLVSTSANTGNTAKLYLRNLEPGTIYEYEVMVDAENQEFKFPLEFDTEPLWDYRTDPPAFSIAMGSCTYINEEAYDRPGTPYGGDYQIFRSIESQKPDAMLWLGDNIYLRDADWWTRSGYIHRYTHTRSIEEMQALMASCNNYAIWDDHDFGPNDASGSWIHRDLALEMFKLFWPNPSFGYRDMPCTFSAFNYRDCDFVMLDNRYYRSEQSVGHPEQIFGTQQIDRMIDLLKQSRAPFKFVLTGGQFLNSAQVFENHSNYEEERDYILKRINDEDIKNVIFISGDRHHSEVDKLQLPNGNWVYEFTVSPLTSGAAHQVNEENDYRVEGSLIQERNFAVMNISGKRKARKLVLIYYNSEGEQIYSWSLSE